MKREIERIMDDCQHRICDILEDKGEDGNPKLYASSVGIKLYHIRRMIRSEARKYWTDNDCGMWRDEKEFDIRRAYNSSRHEFQKASILRALKELKDMTNHEIRNG